MPNDSLTDLANVIAQGLPGPNGGLRPCIDALFGDRYQKRYHAATAVRDAYALADGEEGVPYAGIINQDNPPLGPYGGTSVVWFPSRESGSLIDFGIGTRGLAPDEGVLTRPGHKRRVTALRRYLARMGVETWVKHDPSALGTSVPKTARDRYPGFEHVFRPVRATVRRRVRDVAPRGGVAGSRLDVPARARSASDDERAGDEQRERAKDTVCIHG